MKNYTGALLSFEHEGVLLFLYMLLCWAALGATAAQVLMGVPVVAHGRELWHWCTGAGRRRGRHLDSSSGSDDAEDDDEDARRERGVDRERVKVRADMALMAQHKEAMG